MARPKRPHGAGSLYTKHGSYYGRWMTADGGLANRRLGRVRLPGSREGLTRRQAEKRLRELMDVIQAVSDPERTIDAAGQALLTQLEAKGSAKSHIETAESHLRVHLVPFFNDKPLDRITDTDVTRLLVRLGRLGRKPKTIRNIISTLHSVFELGIRRRWLTLNPVKLVDLPAVPPNTGGIRHRRIPPRTPKRNGKVERYQQTLAREWAYGQRPRSSTARATALPIWLIHYNTTRPHSSIGNRPPISRVPVRKDLRQNT